MRKEQIKKEKEGRKASKRKKNVGKLKKQELRGKLATEKGEEKDGNKNEE